MKIQSPVFENNQSIPPKYTCDGQNINPPLEFVDVPSDAKSLALIVDDPDAPSGLWVHWTVWNIPPQTSGVSENSKFEGGVEGQTSFGKPGYGGPCPPDREHRYFFKLYALDTTLDLSSNTNKPELEKAMEGHIISSAELVGFYNRQ
ncbi:MAG: YbhB/YbcL family Raf kinase inhibitor-like protein [Patescibacteria group bacterium]